MWLLTTPGGLTALKNDRESFCQNGFPKVPPHGAPNPPPLPPQRVCKAPLRLPQNPPQTLPSPSAPLAVDEEFEVVSTQLLKRTQAMLNKYRLLLLEESRVRLALGVLRTHHWAHGTWTPTLRGLRSHGEISHSVLTKAGRAFLPLQLGLRT